MRGAGNRQSHKRRLLRNLLERVDVVGLQQTRGVAADMGSLPASHIDLGAFDVEVTPGTTCKGGVIFALPCEVRERAQEVQVKVHQTARAISVSLLLRPGARCHYTMVQRISRGRAMRARALCEGTDRLLLCVCVCTLVWGTCLAQTASASSIRLFEQGHKFFIREPLQVDGVRATGPHPPRAPPQTPARTSNKRKAHLFRPSPWRYWSGASESSVGPEPCTAWPHAPLPDPLKRGLQAKPKQRPQPKLALKHDAAQPERSPDAIAPTHATSFFMCSHDLQVPHIRQVAGVLRSLAALISFQPHRLRTMVSISGAPNE